MGGAKNMNGKTKGTLGVPGGENCMQPKTGEGSAAGVGGLRSWEANAEW